jgi:hypothetical protein
VFDNKRCDSASGSSFLCNATFRSLNIQSFQIGNRARKVTHTYLHANTFRYSILVSLLIASFTIDLVIWTCVFVKEDFLYYFFLNALSDTPYLIFTSILARVVLHSLNDYQQKIRQFLKSSASFFCSPSPSFPNTSVVFKSLFRSPVAVSRIELMRILILKSISPQCSIACSSLSVSGFQTFLAGRNCQLVAV